MALETREIPKLLFWFLISGIAIYITSKAIGKVGEEISAVFR